MKKKKLEQPSELIVACENLQSILPEGFFVSTMYGLDSKLKNPTWRLCIFTNGKKSIVPTSHMGYDVVVRSVPIPLTKQ